MTPWFFITAGVLSLAVALLHVVAAFSVPLCRYLGAPEPFLARGPVVVAIMTLVLAIVFAIWGLYAFSAVGWMVRLPLLIPALLAIGGVYGLRGVLVVPQILVRANLIHADVPTQTREIVSSLVSLGIGVAYLAGTFSAWQVLQLR